MGRSALVRVSRGKPRSHTSPSHRPITPLFHWPQLGIAELPAEKPAKPAEDEGFLRSVHDLIMDVRSTRTAACANGWAARSSDRRGAVHGRQRADYVILTALTSRRLLPSPTHHPPHTLADPRHRGRARVPQLRTAVPHPQRHPKHAAQRGRGLACAAAAPPTGRALLSYLRASTPKHSTRTHTHARAHTPARLRPHPV